MPNIVFEATRELAEQVDFPKLLKSIHDHFAARGYAPVAAIKSRVIVPVAALSGADPAAQFVVASMRTTVARPPEMEAAMAQHIHDAICAAVAATGFSRAWQCGVFREYVPDERYIKSNLAAR
jgi:5-carboxymethyl-2-hydroxymuconate isomerase